MGWRIARQAAGLLRRRRPRARCRSTASGGTHSPPTRPTSCSRRTAGRTSPRGRSPRRPPSRVTARSPSSRSRRSTGRSSVYPTRAAAHEAGDADRQRWVASADAHAPAQRARPPTGRSRRRARGARSSCRSPARAASARSSSTRPVHRPAALRRGRRRRGAAQATRARRHRRARRQAGRLEPKKAPTACSRRRRLPRSL